MTHERVYIGRSSDRVDMMLASAINHYPEREKMKILFIRESEGVYQFGSKRVFIKIGAGNEVQVRVGGGYMRINDFIDRYTDGEVEKTHRVAPALRMAKKLSIQNVANEQSDYRTERSPVRASQNVSSRASSRNDSPKSAKRRAMSAT